MSQTTKNVLVLAAIAAAAYALSAPPDTPPPPPPAPLTPPPPPKPPAPKPKKPRCPNCPNERSESRVEKISTGGNVSPDGSEKVVCDLPVEQRSRNVGGSDGAGLCVFTSIQHAAKYQNEPVLSDFQKFMRSRPGGGYPGKVDAMVKAIAASKGVQPPAYLQYEGRDPSILLAALESGRMPGVTYNGHDGVHYSGNIAHMVNLVDLSDRWACILDNNFVGENDLVWMTKEEFMSRWTGGGGGWCVVLFAPPPPPVPHN